MALDCDAETISPSPLMGAGSLSIRCALVFATAICFLAIERPACAADAPLPDPIATKQTAFSIPFTLPETSDPNEIPVEVRLYASTDLGHTWTVASRVGPKQRTFAFKAQHDGEYWFAIRTLDRQNHLKPENGRVPELRVIIDTLPPRLELAAHRTAGGDMVAHWVAVDPLIQANTLKIEFQSAGESTWHPVNFDPPASDPSRSTASGDVTWHPATPAIVVRAEIRNRAGNVGTAQAPVSEGLNAPMLSAPSNALRGPAGFGEAPYIAPPANSATPTGTIPNAVPQPDAPAPNGDRHDLTASRNSSPSTAHASTNHPADSSGGTPWPTDQFTDRTVADGVAGSALTFPASRPAGNGAQLPLAAQPSSPRPEFPSGPIESRVNPPVTDRFVAPAAPEQPHSSAPGESPGVRPNAAPSPAPSPPSDMFTRFLPAGERPYMINSRKFALEYEVQSVGAAGLSKVQVWGTRDGGRTWSSFAVEPARNGPVHVNVDGEGLYGFRITVLDGNGVGGKAPQAGDLPELWVGVDLTKPTAQLTGVDLGTGPHAGELAIRWQAADALLAARPITLLFSDHSGGPWSIIAAGLDNTGVYNWRFNGRVPDTIYLRLEARDEAGNVGQFETPDPISLDPNRPHGVIRNVRPEPDEASNSQNFRFYR